MQTFETGVLICRHLRVSSARIREGGLAQGPQLSESQLQADPHWMRFTVVFDREGYSPKFFAECSGQRIGVLTYHKYPSEPWPEAEFRSQAVRLPSGEVVERSLAERRTHLYRGPWMREVRVRSAEGAQGSILSNHPGLDLAQIAVLTAARWSQENFLKYMREHFGLDRLIEHGTQPLPETTQVANPARRRLEQQIRHQRSQLQRLQAQLAAHTLGEAEQLESFTQQGARLQEQIQAQEAQLAHLKSQRAQNPQRLPLKALPEAERYRQLCPESKHFIDTIKMIAYRAESLLAGELREHLHRSDDVRALLRRVFVTSANLRPDYTHHTLTVELHRLGSPLQDAAVAKLCEELTATETKFPTTNLTLVYRQVGSG